MKTILESKEWHSAMRTSFSIPDNRGTLVPETPIRSLIKTFPDLAKSVLDQCYTVMGKSDTELEDQDEGSSLNKIERNQIEMNYEFFDDSYSWKVNDESEEKKTFFEYAKIDAEGKIEYFEDPYYSNGKIWKDNHPLMIMAQQKQKNLLRHPVCLALVRHKWKKFGRYIYYGHLIVYLLFLFSLTAYILLDVRANPCTGNFFPLK